MATEVKEQDRVCGNCKHFEESFHLGGICRAHPPTPVVEDENQCTAWPAVGIKDWCGEWSTIEPTDNKEGEIDG